MQYQSWVKSPENEALRQVENRSGRKRSMDKVDQPLRKTTSNKKQLIVATGGALGRGDSFTKQDMREGTASGKHRVKQQKRLNDAAHRGRMTGDYSIVEVRDEEEMSDDETWLRVSYEGYGDDEDEWRPAKEALLVLSDPLRADPDPDPDGPDPN